MTKESTTITFRVLNQDVPYDMSFEDYAHKIVVEANLVGMKISKDSYMHICPALQIPIAHPIIPDSAPFRTVIIPE